MRVHESHLVKESSRGTDDHVLNMRANGANAGELLAVGKPQVNLDEGLLFFLAFLTDHLGDLTTFHGNVLEFLR